MLAIAFLFKKKVAKLPVVSWFVSVSLRWPEPDRAHAASGNRDGRCSSGIRTEEK